eukprot:UN01905
MLFVSSNPDIQNHLILFVFSLHITPPLFDFPLPSSILFLITHPHTNKTTNQLIFSFVLLGLFFTSVCFFKKNTKFQLDLSPPFFVLHMLHYQYSIHYSI